MSLEHLLILLVFGLIALVRKLFLEGGLEKLLGKLGDDLNRPADEMRRVTPPPLTRPEATSLSPEEERMRQFREALGLPSDDFSRTRTAAPLPAGPTPSQRAREQRRSIERKLAEKRRALDLPPPSVPVPTEEASVSKYFELESFNKPGIEPAKTSVAVQVDTPIIEPDFFKSLEKRELVVVTPETRLSEIFGNGTDLRRLILAQEIFGRPKSLQNA